MRLGVFGGTFDPVHYGHLLMAELCREHHRIDRLLFLPAATAPHKQGETHTPAEQRIEMLGLAIGGHQQFEISPLEVQRGGISYTVDTLAELKSQDPGGELFFLMGADSLEDLPRWKEPGKICELALPVVARRRGWPELDLGGIAGLVSPERLAAIRAAQLELPLIELSSSEIRKRISQGRGIRYQTPRAVEQFILANGLYRENVMSGKVVQ